MRELSIAQAILELAQDGALELFISDDILAETGLITSDELGTESGAEDAATEDEEDEDRLDPGRACAKRPHDRPDGGEDRPAAAQLV